jgi:microcompartment protein CcmK/EutM
MRVARVVGKVTLSRSIPEFQNASLKLVVPLMLDDLIAGENHSKNAAPTETLVAWDLIASGEDSLVAISEGPEAAMPFRPDIKPIDTSVAALLDSIDLEKEN